MGFTVKRAYDINKAERSCQTMMKRAMKIIVSNVLPQGSLEKVERTQKTRTEEAETRDHRSPKSEADPRPARTLISNTVHRT